MKRGVPSRNPWSPVVAYPRYVYHVCADAFSLWLLRFPNRYCCRCRLTWKKKETRFFLQLLDAFGDVGSVDCCRHHLHSIPAINSRPPLWTSCRQGQQLWHFFFFICVSVVSKWMLSWLHFAREVSTTFSSKNSASKTETIQNGSGVKVPVVYGQPIFCILRDFPLVEPNRSEPNRSV